LSVFRFSKTDKVWGLKNGLVREMIDWWIEHAGPRPYLLEIKHSYDIGFNHGDLTEVADEDKAELRDLVGLMLKTGYENRLRLDAASTAQVREHIVELERMLNSDLEGTNFYQPPGG
jgi:hypothetical protein